MLRADARHGGRRAAPALPAPPAERPWLLPTHAQQVGSISNRALAQSLLDIYLGADPVSKGAKESFGAGLAAMVLA